MHVGAPPLLLLVAGLVALQVWADTVSYEGTPCVVDGHNGTCTSMNKCLVAVVYLQDNTTQPQICGYEDKDPIICCTDCPKDYAVNISNAVLDHSVGLLWKRGITAWDKCIDYLHTLPYITKSGIVLSQIEKRWLEESKCDSLELELSLASGGEDTRRGEYPFMALLGYGTEENATQWLCGGALISERFILTAAHCISSRLGPVKYAALGVWKRDEPEEMWQKHNIEKIIPHPDYRPPSKYHDIALLQTEKPVEFTEGSLPACLHVRDEGTYDAYHDDHYALGWGALGYRQPVANILQRVNLKEFSAEECKQHYPAHRHLKRGYDHATQMCYGDKENPRDTCQGDSGGPLLLPMNRVPIIIPYFSHDQVGDSFTITGVTSAGLPCGKAGRPGLYTRVSAYRSWIENIVWG